MEEGVEYWQKSWGQHPCLWRELQGRQPCKWQKQTCQLCIDDWILGNEWVPDIIMTERVTATTFFLLSPIYTILVSFCLDESWWSTYRTLTLN